MQGPLGRRKRGDDGSECQVSVLFSDVWNVRIRGAATGVSAVLDLGGIADDVRQSDSGGAEGKTLAALWER